MIDTKNIEEAKKLIKKSKHPIIIKAQNPEFSRKILEYGKFDILLSPELSENSKDTIKNIHSGFNHVTAKIASKNRISIGIDLNSLRNLEKKKKAISLSRIIQNIKIARKAKTKIKALNFKDIKDTQSLLLSLGASTSQAKEAVSKSP